jgi:hypothetical protein
MSIQSDVAKQKARDLKQSQQAGRGTTTGMASDIIGNPKWTVDLASGTAQKNNPWYDKGIPLAIGGLFGYGLATGGTGVLANLGVGAPATSGTAATTGGTVASTGKNILSGLGRIKSAFDTAGSIKHALSDAGRVASEASKGSQDQRVSNNQNLLREQELRLQAERDAFDAQLRGQQSTYNNSLSGLKFSQTERDAAQRRAVFSSLLSGMQDFKATPGNPAIAAAMGTSTGGARPSALTGGGNREMLMAMLDRPELAAPSFGSVAPYTRPAPTHLDTAGVGEKALSGFGLGTSILDAIRGVGTPKKAGGDLTSTVYNGVPEMPWTLPPDQQDEQNAYANPDELDPTKQRDPYARVRF